MFTFLYRIFIGIHTRSQLYSQLYQAIENIVIHISFRNQFCFIFIFYRNIIHYSILYITFNYIHSNKKHRRSGAFHCVSSVCAVSVMTTVLMMSMSTAATFMPLMTAAMPVCMILAVLMLVAVRTLALIRASLKRSRKMLLHNRICAALHTGYERNARLRKCRLCTRADAATDHNIRFRVVEEARECAMPLTDRVHNL